MAEIAMRFVFKNRRRAATKKKKGKENLFPSACVCMRSTSFLNYTSITAALLNYQMDARCCTVHTHTRVALQFRKARSYSRQHARCTQLPQRKRGPRRSTGDPRPRWPLSSPSSPPWTRFAKRDKSSLNFRAILPERPPTRWAWNASNCGRTVWRVLH